MATHTPGPWSVPKYFGYGTICAEKEQVIARISAVGVRATAANARLIAAAPDLLAALKALTEWGREHTSPRDENSPHSLLIAAVAAIAKAEGRAE